MDRRVVVVTDSTASLPALALETADVVVVPLHVVVDGTPYLEGVDLSPSSLVEALRRGATVTTSQPGPDAFSRVYARAAARGAREIISVHLSGALSGTVTSAELAAQTAGVPVTVVDSRTVGMGLGFAALAAAQAGGDGA
ncbi:DegV family protein, partial [Actinotalea sp. C106]|uniref:DegV family protein n=1 Tax=Actinotalea sp. C106 TaxID=2908644 RepID=UPI002028E2C8